MNTVNLDRNTFRYLITTTQLEFTLRFWNSYFALSEAEGRDLFWKVECRAWEECLKHPTELKHPQKFIRRVAQDVGIEFLRNSGHFVRQD